MVARRNVPRNVERKLWAESEGHCMNPECHTYLIIGSSSIGEMAHIVPHSDGGGTSADNLILLCCNCHQEIDGTRNERTPDILRRWKFERDREIRRKVAKKCKSFEELQDAVVPLLTRNGEIFDDYGPETQMAENHSLWLKFEPELISNNAQIVTILQANQHLLHPQNREVVAEFAKHVDEFVRTRGEHSGHRVNLFPASLCSVFGIELDRQSKPVSNLSALQNFISRLVDEGRFRGLQLEPDPVLFYVDGEDNIFYLFLDDESRVRQIYWNCWSYRPKTTEVRLEDLTFFLQWMRKNSIHYEFPDPRYLTELTLNKETPLVVFYEYCLSVSKLQSLKVCDGLIVVNLHHWNGAPVSPEAKRYAESVGIKAFTQNEFFCVCSQEFEMNSILQFLLADTRGYFDIFDGVYLFGSTLWSPEPGDLDILLVYEASKLPLVADAEHRIIDQMSERFPALHVHLTTLSEAELVSTAFLSRIISVRIK